jgi:hypothetical protein
VGSKQLQLNLRLTFDQLLLSKKIAQQNTQINQQSGASAVNPLLAKLARGVDQGYNKKKQEGEYLKKRMAELGALTPAEQVKRLKQLINE